MELIISTAGQVRCLYDESIDITAIGMLRIERGSHVEPTKLGQWTADLSVVDGPLLGPFERRSEALAAEQAWLSEHWLTSRCHPLHELGAARRCVHPRRIGER